MRSRALWAFFAIALIAAAAAGLWFARPWESRRPPIPEALAPSHIAPPVVQGPRYPPPAPAPVDKPLPRLDESDATLLEALSTLMGPQALAKLVQPERLVRHIVVTIDNLPRQIFAPQFSPVNPPGGQLRTTGQGETLAIAPANAARYTPYVRALEAMDGERLVALYARFHPLFQQAYVELGYPNAFFNDRLVEVIDHLLATPEVKGPVQLVVPHVLAEFADPSLQERSTGQKLLLRMGPENAARVKAKLRELRGALVRQP